VRIICQLSDQIADTFRGCFVTSRFVTFASVLINEHPATATIQTLINIFEIRPDFDIFATFFDLQLSEHRATRFDAVDFPLIIQLFHQCFSEELDSVGQDHVVSLEYLHIIKPHRYSGRVPVPVVRLVCFSNFLQSFKAD